jgi:hypothetical protein
MGWSIPKLEGYLRRQRPRWGRWALGLLLLISIGIGVMSALGNSVDALRFWGYSLGVPVLIWTISLAFVLTQYIYSALASEQYHQHNQTMAQAWQQWSQCQLPVLGYRVISAEPDTLKALTGEEIALYPHKARPLFNPDDHPRMFWFLDDVMQHLQQHYPDHLRYLSHIYIPAALIDDKDLVDAIFERWDLKPEPVNDYAEFITTAIENESRLALSLLLVCQYTDIDFYGYSKFVTAILLGARSHLAQQHVSAKVWLGRMMPTEPQTLAEDIQQLLTYNQLDGQQINTVWASGLDNALYKDLSFIVNQLNPAITEGHALHNIDDSFAQPSLLTPYIISAIACAAGQQQQQPQLVVCCSQQRCYLQLITAQPLRP